MKNNYLFILLLFTVQSLAAQMPYCYEQDTIVTVGSESYYIIDKHYKFKIINTKYTLYDQEMVDFQGNTIEPGDYYGAGVVKETYWQAFTETFTDEEIALMRDSEQPLPTIIYVFVTKDHTGKAIEVLVSAWKNQGTMGVPPEKWAQFVQNIKQYVRWYGVTEDERNSPFSHHTIRVDRRDLQKRFPRREINPDADIITP